MSSSSSLSRDEKALFILILGALTAFGPLSIDMYLPAFTQIGKDFQVSIAQVEWSLAAFFAGLSIGQLFYGPLSDRYGRKRPLIFGMTVYIAASIGCALSTEIEMLVAFRFLQALGGCAGMVISRAMVRDLFNHSESARVFSLLMLVMGLAPILAPIFGGYLLRVSDWHSIFWLISALAALCIFAVYNWLPETHRTETAPRQTNSVLSTYLSILQDPTFTWNALAGGFAQAGMFAYITGSPFVFMELYGISPDHYGWFFGLNAFGLILASQLNARLLKKRSPDQVLRYSLRVTMLAGLALFGSSLTSTLMPGGFVQNVGLMGVTAPLFFYIASLGMVFPNTTAEALAHQGHRAGAASALIGTLQFVLASLASLTVSLMHSKSSLPMTSVIAFCGVSAMISQSLYRHHGLRSRQTV
ncbi:MAG: Bcr/CflA family multidrug efflux MFS transporter [Bdellovibrionales bacterium]|jgi:DHA1 family bicyclomycin/chloramphenicol resistance-like MFS transporter|nr:Bcr/CflA family multidrug efflux MFS transporter [Bdellovibrionales bacterium]